MHPDKAQRLKNNFPLTFAGVDCIDCQDGWYHLIETLCSHIENYIKQLPEEIRDQVYAVRIKQKFGGLKIYMSHDIPIIEGAIDLAVDLSNSICEICGNSGGHKSIGSWLMTLCDKHYKEKIKKNLEKDHSK